MSPDVYSDLAGLVYIYVYPDLWNCMYLYICTLTLLVQSQILGMGESIGEDAERADESCQVGHFPPLLAHLVDGCA